MADPTTQYIYQSGFPSEIAPYAQDLVKQAATFTDLTKNPYQQYTGERVAQLSPLTQQAMGSAQGLDVAGQIGAGSTLAGASGLSALAPTSFTMPGTAGAYMSPFMQDVVNRQQQEAKRQAAIQNQTTQAQAVQAGAFGGARDAIQRAEANRNLQTQLGNIQAQGLQNAFQNAQQQYNAEQQQRLQGAQTGVQAASVLGTLGGQQLSQQKDIIGLQNQLGQQEQQRAQDILNAQYQDYLNYQNFPYKQMGFMSDIIRGVPLTQQSSSIYQAAPTTTQNLLSTGLGAAGIANLLGYGRKEGGTVSSYAKGGAVDSYAYGGSVFDDRFKEYAVAHTDPRRLPEVQRNAVARNDQQTAMDANEQMSLDAAIRRGIAAAAPSDMDQGYADGGIVAFATGDLVKEYGEKSMQPYTPRTAEERAAGVRKQISGLSDIYGTSEVDPLIQEDVQRREAQMGDIQRMGLGSTLLRMAAALQKSGVNPGDRYAGMFGAAAEGADKLQAAKSAAEDNLMKAKIAGAQARQARKDGLTDKAVAAEDMQEKYSFEAQKAAQAAAGHMAQIYGGIRGHEISAAATREAAARPSDLDKQTQRVYNALIESGEPANAKTMAKAAAQAASDLGRYPGDVRAEQGAATQRLKAADAVETKKLQDPAWREAKKNKDTAGMQAREKEMIDEMLGTQSRTAPAPAAPAAAPQGSAPTLQQFLPAARKANPGVSDADLTAYYNRTYGK